MGNKSMPFLEHLEELRWTEPHYATGDAGDRAGTLDDDEQCAGGAARSALALLALPCGVGQVGWVWDRLPHVRAAHGDG